MTPITEAEARALPTRAVDARGRIIPLTPDQLAARAEAYRRFLAGVVARAGQSPPGTDEAFMRAIDERRPHRPLFEGMY